MRQIKTNIWTASISFLLVFLWVMTSCRDYSKEGKKTNEARSADAVTQNTSKKENKQLTQNFGIPYTAVFPNEAARLSEFVRRIFQDSKGNFWMGTNGDGVARYNGDTLDYFTMDEGFGGNAVRGIVEDAAGNIWFATSGGVTKFNGTSFTNFTQKDGLASNDIWCITIDQNGTLWIGGMQGVNRYNGKQFTSFYLPESKPDFTRGVTSSKIVHAIMEDRKGHMWFATNGGGYRYDGTSLFNLSVKDGLAGNTVNHILEDQSGHIWFATHANGISRYNGTSFTNFNEKQGVLGTEVWSIYEDRSGNIWFPVEGFGVYRYNGESFTNFAEKEGLVSLAMQCIYEDSNGRIWFGGWQGLFGLNEGSIFSVTKNKLSELLTHSSS